MRQMGDATTYQTALIAALVDEVITEDEWSMLEVMRRSWAFNRMNMP